MEQLFVEIIFGACRFIGARLHYPLRKLIGKGKPLRIVSHGSYSIFNTLLGLVFLVGLIIEIVYVFVD